MLVIRQPIVVPQDEAHDVRVPRRRIFLVHGRNLAAKEIVSELLRSFELEVLAWDVASRLAGGGTPSTIDVIVAGMKTADAVVVLLTPDDQGSLKPEFWTDRDGPSEREPTPQPRMNVLFEAGLAMAFNEKGTILLEIGSIRPMSDTVGFNALRMSAGSISERLMMADRLEGAGLTVNRNSPTWATAGDFGSLRL